MLLYNDGDGSNITAQIIFDQDDFADFLHKFFTRNRNKMVQFGFDCLFVAESLFSYSERFQVWDVYPDYESDEWLYDEGYTISYGGNTWEIDEDDNCINFGDDY